MFSAAAPGDDEVPPPSSTYHWPLCPTHHCQAWSPGRAGRSSSASNACRRERGDVITINIAFFVRKGAARASASTARAHSETVEENQGKTPQKKRSALRLSACASLFLPTCSHGPPLALLPYALPRMVPLEPGADRAHRPLVARNGRSFRAAPAGGGGVAEKKGENGGRVSSGGGKVRPRNDGQNGPDTRDKGMMPRARFTRVYRGRDMATH